MEDKKKEIFKKGSRTYYYSSIFFPKKMYQEVKTLYAFVRTADDYVDKVPPARQDFFEFKERFNKAWNGIEIESEIISDFIKLSKKRDFQKEWIDAFLKAMESDLNTVKYQTVSEVEEYIYGSAEVIGLMMAQIMELDIKSHHGAQMLGKAMQYINFIRDIEEDNQLNRQYIAQAELDYFKIPCLKKECLKDKEQEFRALIDKQLAIYNKWQKEAEASFKYIPIRYRIAIETASDMYNYTAKQIQKNPMQVFDKKIKPSKLFIITTGIKNVIKILWK